MEENFIEDNTEVSSQDSQASLTNIQTIVKDKKLNENKKAVIVNYLPKSMTQEEVQSLFSCVGRVESCKLVRNSHTGESLCYGFVNYYKEEDAQQAINTLNGLRTQGKVIRVSLARPCSEEIKGANLYVCGLPRNMTQREFDKIFSPFGKIITSRVLTDGKHYVSKNGVVLPGVGFVRYDKRSEAELAIDELDGTIPEGLNEPLSVKFANPPGGKSREDNNHYNQTRLPVDYPMESFSNDIINPVVPQPMMSPLSCDFRPSPGPIHRVAGRMTRYSPLTNSPQPPLPNITKMDGGHTIFVFNLCPNAQESELWRLFGPFGAVQNVKLIEDPETKKCKGFGFVTMLNYDEATAAIRALDGSTLDGRILQVSFKTKTKHKQ